MERVTYEDFDFFLNQMKTKFNEGAGNEQKFIEDAYKEQDCGMGFSVRIPEEFEQADKENAAEIFWSEKRPAVIYITPKREEGITFQFLDDEIGENALSDCKKIVKQLIERIDERCVFYSMGEESGSVWFDYKSFAKNETVYNMVFLFRAGGRKILGTFYCIFESYDKWKPMILEMLETIRTKEGTDERL